MATLFFWIFIRRTDSEAEAPILWPTDGKNWLIRGDPDAGKDWWEEEKGTAEDEMVGWVHQLDGHEFERPLGVGDRQGGLMCCSPWGRKESDMTEWTQLTLLFSVTFTFLDSRDQRYQGCSSQYMGRVLSMLVLKVEKAWWCPLTKSS